MDRIYFDYNASTPISRNVALAMKPYLETLVGNPSSSHWAGKPFKEVLTASRLKVARALGAAPDEIIFTSGGSEANNFAIKGIFFANINKGKHIITSSIEHPAVINPCEYLKKFGAEVTYLPVDAYGRVNPKDLEKEIRYDTILVSIMHANNEVGTIQPIKELASISKSKGVYFHTDSAQSFGKIATDVTELGVDLLSIAAHKFYGPKGVGVLYIKKGTIIDSLIHGASHEFGLRAGTENVLLNVALGVACEKAQDRITQMNGSVRELRDYFWNSLKNHFKDDVELNSKLDLSLPNTLSVAFVNRSGNQILASIPEIAASTGSACHSGKESMSSVLKAMGISENVGLGTIRFSLGVETTKEEIDFAIALLNKRMEKRSV